MDIDPEKLHTRDRYGLLTSLVVPRPIAWITTLSASGQENLAPFSYFNGVASDPMLISVSISDKRGGVAKDTLRNIRDTGVFCVHLVEEPLVEAMNRSSADFPPDVAETEELGLATTPCQAIRGVRLRDARAALECRLVDSLRYGRTVQTNLVIAEVVYLHVDDGILAAGDGPRIDPEAIAPVARLGGTWYAKLGERFALERGAPRR